MREALFALAGVIDGFFLTLLKDVIFRSQQKRAAGCHLAIRVVCELDNFVEQSVAVIADEGTETPDGILEPDVGSPLPINYPTGVEWQSIDPNLMYDLLELPNRVRAAEQAISSVLEHVAGPPDYAEFFEERSKQYSELGRRANKMARSLRQKYAIPENPDKYVDPAKIFSETVLKVEAIQTERQKRSTAFHAELFGQSGAKDG